MTRDPVLLNRVPPLGPGPRASGIERA